MCTHCQAAPYSIGSRSRMPESCVTSASTCGPRAERSAPASSSSGAFAASEAAAMAAARARDAPDPGADRGAGTTCGPSGSCRSAGAACITGASGAAHAACATLVTSAAFRALLPRTELELEAGWREKPSTGTSTERPQGAAGRGNVSEHGGGAVVTLLAVLEQAPAQQGGGKTNWQFA